MNATTQQAIEKYIRSIRNAQKRHYAQVYYDLMKENLHEYINNDTFSLSVMGMQAVRIAIANIVKQSN